ncbi:hypothetical protein GLW20_12775 [Virgibacillus halodenitrificans]|nr:hypothetical protein [Virgibacillus halodenitrificans]
MEKEVHHLKKALLLFLLFLAFWFVLAGRITIPVFLLGAIICSIVLMMTAKNALTDRLSKYRIKKSFLKIYYLFSVITSFLWDLFRAAVRVSRHAFAVKPTYSPQIVKIKTSLENKKDSAILANYITFPTETLAMDFDRTNKSYTIHWLDIPNDNEVKRKKAEILKHEILLAKIFD